MAEETKESVYIRVDLHSEQNNAAHNTAEISEEQLIVRRGQSFNVSLHLAHPYNNDFPPIVFCAMTGSEPDQELGTLSFFSFPDTDMDANEERLPSAKAVWMAELHKSSSPQTGSLNIVITPPADAPIGEYIVCANYRDEEMLLAMPVVLFNPWCPDDWVFLSDEKQRQEYVMNEQGIIFKGSGNYIFPMQWDFGQFEESMVDIGMKLLDLNHKHFDNPADDVSARCNPIYVGRVISAMINSEDDHGVLKGQWEGPYTGGVVPSHWNGSYAILKQWLKQNFHPVRYGQCWVFAGVMCSVMRLLGIPCRVVTNFQSAHDTDRNLTIDVYHSDYGVEERPSHDSVWNFHVWVEGWMRRPDLAEDGTFDGWQVLDPTPQEMSDGVYCCGPAPVKAIQRGETHLKYDIPFVFAEVNADCIDWLVKSDGSLINIWSDTKRVGQNISTKSVGSNKRWNITNTYKIREGSDKERSVFKYACTRDYSRVDGEEEEEEEYENAETEENVEMEDNTSEVTPVIIPPLPKVFLRFDEVTQPKNGEDVRLKLVLNSESSVAIPLSISITVQAMRYNGSVGGKIQTEASEQTLQPGKELSVPILVPFSAYNKPMLDCESMKVSALVKDKLNPDNVFLAEDDVVLLDPPISLRVFSQPRRHQECRGEMVFENPIKETLTNCTLSLSGSGLWKDVNDFQIGNMKPNTKIIVQFTFRPYKSGKKTLTADFDCDTFRDIKTSCVVDVLSSFLFD